MWALSLLPATYFGNSKKGTCDGSLRWKELFDVTVERTEGGMRRVRGTTRGGFRTWKENDGSCQANDLVSDVGKEI